MEKTKNTKKKISYQQSIEEIEQILLEIESGELDVDELSDKLKRASELLKICKTKLKKTEQEIQDILNEINE